MRWAQDAACRPSPHWTSDERPQGQIEANLAAICAGCPVRRECAAHAVDSRAESGTYAGVWLPPRQPGARREVGWERARRKLTMIAIGDEVA